MSFSSHDILANSIFFVKIKIDIKMLTVVKLDLQNFHITFKIFTRDKVE